jgi:hypothetical protein
LEYDKEENEEDERKGGGFLAPMPDSITIVAAARPTAIGEEHSGERAVGFWAVRRDVGGGSRERVRPLAGRRSRL